MNGGKTAVFRLFSGSARREPFSSDDDRQAYLRLLRDLLAKIANGGDLALAEQGLADWAETLDTEDRS